MISNINPHILQYIEMVESDTESYNVEQHELVALVRKCFETEDIYTDEEQLEKYFGLVKYFPFERLFPWEEFCIALHLSTYWTADKTPRWPDLFLFIGRGAGKDGYIAFESLCLISPYNPVPKYDVDICANAEEQAMRPVNDLLEVLDDTKFTKKLKKFFYWTKEKITGLRYRGIIKGRTNAPGSKDGMRSGMVVFNEIHQYLNYANIKVFRTGLGKKPHPRQLYATTNGDVRDGPLDDMLKTGKDILKGVVPDNGMLPFICKLDDKKFASDKSKWQQANPSLPYLPVLMGEIEKEFIDWKANPIANADFMTKRMNLPEGSKDIEVTAWENILATNKPVPDTTGRNAVVGVDYATVNDFASAGILMRVGSQRVFITHSWLCLKSKDLFRIKAPYREWAALGLLTLVDDVAIHPDLIAEWISKQASEHNVTKLAIDNNRYGFVTESLKKVGFDWKEYKNVKLVRPSDIMQVVPVVNDCFVRNYFTWGDNPLLRWAANNTKIVKSSKSIGSDTGNMYYSKIEQMSRKTDPFMCLVHAMCIESELGNGETVVADMPVYEY